MARRMSRLRLYRGRRRPAVLALAVRARAVGRRADLVPDRREARADRAQEGPRARPHHDDLELHGADRRAAGRHHPLQGRQVRIEADLERKRAELARLQDVLRQERIRLVQLRARLAESRAALSRAARRALQGGRARHHDRDPRVRRLRRPARAGGVHAARLPAGQADHRPRAHARRPRPSRPSAGSTGSRTASARSPPWSRGATRRSSTSRSSWSRAASTTPGARETKHAALVATRSDRHALEDDLAALEREQAKIAARLSGTGTSPPARSARARAGSSGRVNGPFTSPFGFRWGRLHAGIDIAVSEGTPIRAADSGSVALAGWTGGYGNYTCINHGGGCRPATGTSRAIATSVGASVNQGQVIGYVGCTGNSTRPASAFRGARERAARRPHGLPLGGGRPCVPCSRCSRRSTSAP